MFYCPHCNSAIFEDSSQFCPSCGGPIPSGYDRHIQVNYAWSGQEDESMRFSGRMSRPELKRAAKDRLSGNWGKAIGLGLVVNSSLAFVYMVAFYVFFLLLFSIVLIQRSLSDDPIILGPMLLGIIPVLIFWGPLKYGNDAFFLQLFQERKPKFALLFQGFEQFGKSCWMGVLKFLLLTGWYLLFAIPGIVKQLSYSMSYFILRDHPEMTAREAIRASKELMKGNKGELFVLHLSFIGWYLLNQLAYGMLEIFYLRHYRNACLAAFYEELKARKTPRILPEAERPLWDRPDVEPAQEA